MRLSRAAVPRRLRAARAVRLLGLTNEVARHIVTHHGQFDVALAIARGYGFDGADLWAVAAYQQAVCRGNVVFVKRMQSLGMRLRPLVPDIVSFYRREIATARSIGTLASRRANLQALLRECLDDVVALHELCVVLEFTELAAYLKEGWKGSLAFM